MAPTNREPHSGVQTRGTRLRGLVRASILLAVAGLGLVGMVGPALSRVSDDDAEHTAACRASSWTGGRALTVTPEMFGAVGDGVADDTEAVQQALDAVTPGGTVRFAAGQVYRHTDVLVADVAGSHLTGAGTLLATNEERSAFWITADDIVADGGLAFRMESTTRRWDAFEQMKIRLAGVDGVVLQNVLVDGSAAAGIYVGRSSNFALFDVTVRETRADGIHMTGGSRDGIVCRPTVINSGDDGVAVVSYQNDGALTRRILIRSPTVRTTLWGRGLSVVGGEDISYRDISVTRSAAAAVYVANEGAPYNTYSVRRVSFSGGTLTESNTEAEVDHGAILLSSAQAGEAVDGVTIDHIAISGTRQEASRQVGVLAYDGTVSQINLCDISVTGGGHVFTAEAPPTSYNTFDWVVDGEPIADHWGWGSETC